MKTKRLYAPGLSARDLPRDSISSSVPPPLPPVPSWKALSMLDTCAPITAISKTFPWFL